MFQKWKKEMLSQEWKWNIWSEILKIFLYSQNFCKIQTKSIVFLVFGSFYSFQQAILKFDNSPRQNFYKIW